MTPDRIALWSRAVLLALAAAVALHALGGAGPATGLAGRIGGDFPAFWGAGRIVLEGDVAHLYDWDRQAAAQVGLHPGDPAGTFLAFAYPPFVALAYAPLAALPYRLAWLLHTTLAVSAVGAAIALVRPSLPRLAPHPEALLVASIAFYPLGAAIGGAQNTPFTLLGLAAVLAGLRHPEGRAAAGVAAGLLAYKPQLAVPILGLLLVAREGRALAAATLTLGALWAVGAAAAGPAWPLAWWRDGVIGFQAHDADVNGPNAVSVLGFAEAVGGVGHPVALALAVPTALALAAATALAWARSRPADLPERMALAAFTTILVTPHGMFYDAGIATLGAWVLMDRGPTAIRVAVALAIPLAATQAFARDLGFSPIFALLLVGWALAWRATWRRR